MIRLIAFDLDGTLTQHKTPLEESNRHVLDQLRANGYDLLMIGAGQCARIFRQMGNYPISVIGNYGMQFSRYDSVTGTLQPVFDECLPCDRESVRRRVCELRTRYGWTEFAGDSVEFHPSGCVTFAILGTKAEQADKLAFDPERSKRRRAYPDVVRMFPEYTVFVGGSSSFDMVPKPFDKYYALSRYCAEHGLRHDEVVFVGDDYGTGGNDEPVYRSDIRFICADNYMQLEHTLEIFLKNGEKT